MDSFLSPVFLIGKSECRIIIIYFILFYLPHNNYKKYLKRGRKQKKKKKEVAKWRGDLTETIGAYERLGLLEL